MKKEELNKVLNNFKSVTISITTILDFCIYDGTVLNDDLIKRKSSLYLLSLHNNNISLDDVSSITVRKDGLYYNLKKLLSKISDFYNIKECNTFEIKSLINRLKNIKSEDDIKKISSSLYKEYQRFINRVDKESYKNKIKYRNKVNNSKRTIEERNLKNEHKAIENKTSSDVENYKERLKRIYELYPIVDIEKELDNVLVKAFIDNHIYNLNDLAKLSKDNFESLSLVPNNLLESLAFDKFSLVVATTIMNLAIKNKDNKALHKNALKYLDEYVKNNKYLVSKNFGLEKRYNDVLGISTLKKYEVSSIVDFINSSSEEKDEEIIQDKKEVESENINKYNYSFMEYDSKEKSREVLGTYKKLGNNEVNNETATKVLNDKISFYENLGYEKIRVGVDSFDGYVGFELDNGVVILDKFFENMETGKIAVDEAIYITTTDEFDKVTKLSKSKCMEKIKNKELNVTRVIHQEGWQDRVVTRSKELIKKD